MFKDSVGAGVASVAALTLLGIVLAFSAAALGGAVIFWCFLLIGLTQLVYIVPLCVRWKTSKPAAAKGVIIGASIVALLNATCWGGVWIIFR